MKGAVEKSEGVSSFPWFDHSPIVLDFFKLVASDCWVDEYYSPEFCQDKIKDPGYIANASLSQLKSLLTYCERGEKFCEGHWNYVLKNGYVKQILERVKHLFQTDTDTSRRIFKAVYLILEKYHRLYGLEAYFFSGGHGPGYVGFQVAAARCFDSGKTDANYDQADISGRTSLVTYLAHIGIPAWSSVSGEQIEGNPKKLGRTRDVERWLESHLTLNQLFSHYEAEISRWRVTYSVEASEKYLLMIRLAGLLARNTGDFPRAPPQCFSDYDPTTPQRVLNIERLLGGLCSRHEIMGINNIFIGSNGLALVNERDTVNVWIHYLEGQNVEQIVSSLESLVDRS